MYEIFGEFDSIEELNMAAEGQIQQGDRDSFFSLARENGIDEVAAEAYWNGEANEFTDYFSAAIGKLEVEKGAIKSQMPVAPIVDYLSSLSMDEGFARLVRCKDKKLKDCIDYIEKAARKKCSENEPWVADQIVFDWAKEYYTEE